MRTQVLFVVTIGAALVVPAVAIHIGGFLAYLATIAAFLGAWWQIARNERRAIARQGLRVLRQPETPHRPPASSTD